MADLEFETRLDRMFADTPVFDDREAFARQVVTRLEKRGLVRREPDPDDGRSTRAVLTASGRAAVEEAAPGHVAEVRRVVLDPLTRAQVKQLAAIGKRIVGVLDPEDRCLED